MARSGVGPVIGNSRLLGAMYASMICSRLKEAIVQIKMNAELLGLLGQLADQLSIR
jgi:hypothetical protein